MTDETIKSRAQNLWASIKNTIGLPGIALTVAVVIVLGFVGFQQYCDRRTETIEDDKIKAYESELQQKNAQFQIYLDAANNDHRTTTMILDAMTQMSKNITDLAENDKSITARVNQIAENEYAAARSQKNNQVAVKSGRVKNTKPLRTREIEALKVDEELYPNE